MRKLDIPEGSRILGVTGHRPEKLNNDYALTSPLVNKIRIRLRHEIRMYSPAAMITGMALGIDTVFAMLAVELSIPFIAAIPFKNQQMMWASESQALYNELLEKAHMVVNVSGRDYYQPQYMQQRNKWVVRSCTRLLAVWNGTSGGTANCVQYAQTKMDKKDIIIINPSFIPR